MLCLFHSQAQRVLFRLSRRLLQPFPEQGLDSAATAGLNSAVIVGFCNQNPFTHPGAAAVRATPDISGKKISISTAKEGKSCSGKKPTWVASTAAKDAGNETVGFLFLESMIRKFISRN